MKKQFRITAVSLVVSAWMFVGVSHSLAADLTGTNGSDIFSFQSVQQQLTTTIVNPYSGESININEFLNVNIASYDGLSGIDTLFMTNAGDAIFIENHVTGVNMVASVEVFFAGDGGDIIHLASTIFSLPNTVIDGGNSADIVWANIGNDNINGRAGNDIMDGGPGDDIVNGREGNDHIFFGLGSGVDDIDGGADFDEIVFTAGITLGDLTITPTGPAQFDIVVGAGGDAITASNIEQLRFADGSVFDLASDLSPWKNIAGPNLGIDPDITLSGPVQDGVPIQVSVDVFNRGDITVTDPVEVLLTSDQGAILDTDANGTADTKTIAVAIAPGASASVAFTWTPHDVAPDVTELRIVVDPNAAISESDETNNLTTRAVAFENPIPEFFCIMFEPPLITDDPGTMEVERLTIRKKSKRTIPVKVPLEDEIGFAVTHLDIPASDDGVVRPPVINVLYNSIASGDGIVDESALLNPGIADDDNVFRFDEFDQKWIHNLRTKHLTAPGTYTIFMTSGDSDAYTINQDSCTISFEREG